MNDWAKYLGLGIMPPAGLVAGYFLGLGLDHLFHTHFWYIVLLIAGVAGGVWGLIREIQS